MGRDSAATMHWQKGSVQDAKCMAQLASEEGSEGDWGLLEKEQVLTHFIQLIRQINNSNCKQSQDMIKRYYQRREAKCNFCFEWFSSECTLKNSIHLCGPCIEKALNTTCYKVPSPDGRDFYQLYLFRNNLKITVQSDPVDPDASLDSLRNNFLEGIDDYRNQELKKMACKWAEITEEVGKLPSFGELQMKQYTEILDESIRAYPTAKEILNRRHSRKPEPLRPRQIKQTAHMENPAEVYLMCAEQPRQSEANPKQKQKNKPGHGYNSPLRSPLAEMVVGPSNHKKPTHISDLSKGSIGGKKLRDSTRNKNSEKLKVESFRVEDVENINHISTPSKESLLENGRKRQQFVPYTKEKREKDLQLIAQNALKSKIYNYLQNFSSVPPALYLPMTLDIYDAVQNTSCLNKCIELVSHSMGELDIKCYLNMLEWGGVDILKLVKVGLKDEQFRDLLHFIKDKRLESLVVTSNLLTEESVVCLGEINAELAGMKNLYLGRNRIHKIKVKDILKEIQNKFVLYL